MNKKYLLALGLLLVIPLSVKAPGDFVENQFPGDDGDDTATTRQQPEDRRTWRPRIFDRRPTTVEITRKNPGSSGTRVARNPAGVGDNRGGTSTTPGVVVVRGDGQATDLSTKQIKALVEAANKNKRGWWIFKKPSALPKAGVKLSQEQQNLCKHLIEEIYRDPTYQLKPEDIRKLTRSEGKLVRQILNSAKDAVTSIKLQMEDLPTVEQDVIKKALDLKNVSFSDGFETYKKQIFIIKRALGEVEESIFDYVARNGKMPQDGEIPSTFKAPREPYTFLKGVSEFDKDVNDGDRQTVIKAFFAESGPGEKSLLQKLFEQTITKNQAKKLIFTFEVALSKDDDGSKEFFQLAPGYKMLDQFIAQEKSPSLENVISIDRSLVELKADYLVFFKRIIDALPDENKINQVFDPGNYPDGSADRQIATMIQKKDENDAKYLQELNEQPVRSGVHDRGIDSKEQQSFVNTGSGFRSLLLRKALLVKNRQVVNAK